MKTSNKTKRLLCFKNGCPQRTNKSNHSCNHYNKSLTNHKTKSGISFNTRLRTHYKKYPFQSPHIIPQLIQHLLKTIQN